MKRRDGWRGGGGEREGEKNEKVKKDSQLIIWVILHEKFFNGNLAGDLKEGEKKKKEKKQKRGNNN